MFPHPPGRSFDIEDHRVVHEPVEDGCNDRVTEDLPPFGKPPVGGDQSRVTLLIAGVHHVKEDPAPPRSMGSSPTSSMTRTLGAVRVLSLVTKVPSRLALTKVNRPGFDGDRQPTRKVRGKRLAGSAGLVVTLVVQQAKLGVTDWGTEATSATGIAVGSTAIPASTSIAIHHSYLFLIRDNKPGAILFAAEVSDPAAS